MFVTAGATCASAQTPSPPGAKVYFISLKDGAELDSPFLVQFGLLAWASHDDVAFGVKRTSMGGQGCTSVIGRTRSGPVGCKIARMPPG
jgi:hypothetical protein